MTDLSYCPDCGEPIDMQYVYSDTVTCDNCDETVEPVPDPEEATMPHKALHRIRCSDCEEPVQLVGLHMGEFTDGVLAACDCFSLGSLPSELGEDELPSQWGVEHDSEILTTDTEPETQRI